jgi:tetratricopeptide (TPR) repeat protein
MSASFKRILIYSSVVTAFYSLSAPFAVHAQIPIATEGQQGLLKHCIEQFQQKHYVLAAQSAENYLTTAVLPTDNKAKETFTLAIQQINYIKAVSRLKAGLSKSEAEIIAYIDQAINPTYRQRAAFALAQYYFAKNQLGDAITYYELAGIDNLSNAEIADSKFELAYSYFNESNFDKAKPLFASIKEMPDNKYYNAGNYYYGLLAFNDKNYEAALKSFNRIDQLDAYKEIVPYYQAEIYYFLGQHDKVLNLSDRYLRKKDKQFYHKEMQLLTAQTLFEQKKYKEALPYFEYYYDNSEQIRKEELYEIAFTYYRLEKWAQAIQKFQPLSNAHDSLGQTSMYLLGDCYLKTGDKKGARNAFGICSEMNFNTGQQEAASFLYAKLSYELGDESIATRKFNEFIKTYPQSKFINESQFLLGNLLTKSKNYAEAFQILSEIKNKDNATWNAYQQVALSTAIELIQNKKYTDADSILTLSLQNPVSKPHEAIAYFWKGDIAYKQQQYAACIADSKTFLDKVKGQEELVRKISTQATVQNANVNIGYAALESENYEGAQQAFVSAREQSSGSDNGAISIDATIREADALFMQKQFDKALPLYNKAIAHTPEGNDYATYQKALILGLQEKDEDKIKLLHGLATKSPASSYKHDAEYELAVSYIEQDRFGEAIGLLSQLEEQKSIPDNLKAKSMMKLAYAYQENEQTNLAIDQYKKYISTYPAAADRVAALDALRNLYINNGQPEQYAAFLKSEQIVAASDNELEQTFYEAAATEYGNSNWNKAIDGFSKYLGQYPNGAQVVKATYYRGDAYAQTQNYDKAMADLKVVLDAGWNEFTDAAAAKAGDIALQQKLYSDAITYYNKLLSASKENSYQQKAYQGLMVAQFETQDYPASVNSADALLALPDVNVNSINDALLYKAKGLQQAQKYDEAKGIYSIIDKKNVGVTSAEARYRIAEILLAQNDLNAAETQASYAAQNASGSEYWSVKSYILIADVLTAQKDYFNAKATLQSIVKNAKDKTIKEVATKKLEQVKALEKNQSKLKAE